MTDRFEATVAAFREHFQETPQFIVSAPGRVNLIGEHTDYNEGFVFPAAINRGAVIAACFTDGDSTFVSQQMGGAAKFSADTVSPADLDGWGSYVAGVAWALRQATGAALPNFRGLITSDLPIGSGLSSSAAMELASGVLWNAAAGLGLSNQDLALAGQKCENQFVGVNSGVMDQLASALGRSGQAMFIDIQSLTTTYAPIPEGVTIAVCDTGMPRTLAGSAYNVRRSQCEEACKRLGVPSLRMASLELLTEKKAAMDEVVFRRARHVITENQRCCEFAAALQVGNLQRAGQLMYESHASLRDDYEVSSVELNAMEESARVSAGVIGARLTGAGFGGACVALVHARSQDEFRENVSRGYRDRAGKEANILFCQAAEGARVVQR